MPCRAMCAMQGENRPVHGIAAVPPDADKDSPDAGTASRAGLSMRQAAAYITRANTTSWMTTGVTTPRRAPA